MVRKNSGFTLLEIIFVVSIIAVIYFVALPQFNLITGTEVAEKLGRLSSDISSAYDMAVLHGKPYRLVFELNSGDYYLEEPDRKDIYLADEKVGREPSEEELLEMAEVFEAQFVKYEDINGEGEIRDPETDKLIKPISPVIRAKKKLQPVKWTKVDNLEWQRRSVGPYLGFFSVQTELHAEPQTLDLLGEKARVSVYFFPQGYVQQCILQVKYTTVDGIDGETPGYTIYTNPYEGTANVVTETQEIQIKERDEL